MRYAWKLLLAFALLLALVIAGLYVSYKVTEPQGDRTDAGVSDQQYVPLQPPPGRTLRR